MLEESVYGEVDAPCPVEDDSYWRFDEKYNSKSYDHFISKFEAKNTFELDLIITDITKLAKNSVKSFDLLTEILEYVLTIEECNKLSKELCSEFKHKYLMELKEAKKSAGEYSGDESADIIKSIESQIKSTEEKILVIDGFLKNPSLFSKCSKSFGNKYLNFMFELIGKIDINYVYTKNIIKIINNFYKDKKNINERRFMNRFNSLCKELKLNNTEKCYLGLMLFDFNSFQTCPEHSKVKNLRKFGILNQFYSKSKYFYWVENYINKNMNFSDSLINSKSFDSNIEIDFNDYSYSLQEKIKNVENLIKNYNRKTPLNILLWGEAGCGKTTLVNLLQKNIPSKKFIMINEELLNNNITLVGDFKRKKEENIFFETKASLRMQELRIFSNVSIGNNFVFVMDESDDTLNSSHGIRDGWLTGKKELNELLEELRVPVIWITNHKSKIDPSTCRRFQYSIKFERLTPVQRLKVWEKQIDLTKTKKLLDGINIKNFSLKYDLTPGVISVVLSNLKTLKPKKSDVESTLVGLIENHLNLVDEKEIKDNRMPNNCKYDIDGLNINSQFSLNDIVKAVRKKINSSNKNLCLLFNGPPGTGKTEFAKYIARELDKELKYFVYGDLASCWVGETEHNIQKAFEDAEREDSILFFDEADSLINPRESSNRSWEVTQTNEVLTRMERFNGIFIASTNFIKNIDGAAMRRFQFKIEFDYLDNYGKKVFFNRFFDMELKSDKLDSILNLSPGDFKSVRDKLELLETEYTEDVIINELINETSYKNGNKKIGFNKID